MIGAMEDLGAQGLFFVNSTTYGGIAAGYWSAMAADLGAAMTQAGLPVRPFDLTDTRAAVDLLDGLAGNRAPPFCVTFNLSPRLQIEGDGLRLWKRLPCPLVTLLLDHPVHLGEAIGAMNRDGQAGPRLWGAMEQGHLDFLRQMGLGGDSLFLLPQAGPPPAPAVAGFAERPVPIAFTGSIDTLEGDAAFAAGLGLEPRATALAVAEILDGGDDPFTITLRHLSHALAGRPAEESWRLARALDRRARTLRRWRLFAALEGLPVHIHGDIHDDFRRRFPGFAYPGPLTWPETLELYGRSKLVLNDTINLRGSALIRLYYAMARGAVAATEMNGFLATNFHPEREVLGLDARRPGEAGRVAALLADPARWQGMARAASARASSRHQWRHRLAPLVRALKR